MATSPSIDILPGEFDDEPTTHVRVKVRHGKPVPPMKLPSIAKGLRDAGYAYARSDAGAIARYLEEHELVAQIITPLAKRVGDFFPKARLRLDLEADPETDETDVTLCVVIEASQPRDEALSIRRRFDREWWFAHTRPGVYVSIEADP